jgi:hypothetical protein
MTREPKHTLVNIAPTASDRAGGTSADRQFVINLCTLTAPITIPQPRAAQLTRYSFFLSRAWIDGRRQYQLHMGYFFSIAEADKWLTILKRVYPNGYVSEAPESQPDLLSNTQRLRILNIGQIGGARDGTHGVGSSDAVGNSDAGGNATPRKRPVAGGLPATRELFVRPTGVAPPAGRTNRPSLEDTLDELRTSEFAMGEEDDLNSTGVRHLRIEVQSDTRPLRRSGSPTRK